MVVTPINVFIQLCDKKCTLNNMYKVSVLLERYFKYSVVTTRDEPSTNGKTKTSIYYNENGAGPPRCRRACLFLP